MKFALTIYLYLLVASFLPQRMISQTLDRNFRHLTTEDGLSEGVVYCIIQDHKGFMWFGTHDGVNRYDGYTCKVFKHDPYDSTSLSNNQVTALFEDSHGAIWIGTQNGLNRFDSKTETFKRFQHDPDNPKTLLDNAVGAISEDKVGNLWIGTSFGLDYIPNSDLAFATVSSNVVSHVQSGFKDAIRPIIINSLYCDPSGILWIGTQKQLYSLYQGDTSVTLKISEVNEALSLLEHPKGTLWIGTFNGLLQYDIEKGTITHHPELISKETHDKTVRSILADAKGSLWMATFNGLYQHSVTVDSFQNYLNDPKDIKSLNNNRTYSLFIDKSSVLWIGTFGSGVNYTLLERKQFHTIRNNDKSVKSQNFNMVSSVMEDRTGNLWVGTFESGIAKVNRGNSTWTYYLPIHPKVNTISEDYFGNVWIGTNSGLTKFSFVNKSMNMNEVLHLQATCIKRDSNFLLVSQYAKISKIDIEGHLVAEYHFDSSYHDFAGTFLKDKNGILWISEQGLCRFDPSTGSSLVYRHNPNDVQSISSNKISTLCKDNANVLWIGTAGQGLNRLNEAAGTFTHFREKQGLANDYIYEIVSEEAGYLWLSTNKGISKFDPVTESFRNYDVEDGLQANEFNRGASFRNKLGEMFFGGVNGITHFFPEEIKNNPHIPTIILTDFFVFNTSRKFNTAISEIRDIVLSYNENFFALEFAALDFVNSKKNKYSYKLEGVDHEWIYSGTRRLASYTDVQPGNYVFHVKGSNNDGVWNEEGLTISITIIPPYWATWWFRLFLIILLLSVAPIIYVVRVSRLKKEQSKHIEFSRQLIESQENERKRIAAALHDSLGQDLIISKNHAMMALKASKEPLEIEHLKEISALLSQSLEDVREIAYNLRPYHLDRIGLTRTIEYIIHKIKSSTNIECTTDFDNLDKMLSPDAEINLYRIVQESLNNVVKHSGATHLNFSIKRNAHDIQLVIRDNGKGFDSSSIQHKDDGKGGFGLRGMEERAQLLHGTFKIQPSEGKGTTVIVTIPLEKT